QKYPLQVANRPLGEQHIQNRALIPPAPKYKRGIEFTNDPQIINGPVGLENDPRKLRAFLQQNPQLSEDSKEHLNYRISCMERVEELQKHPTNHLPLGNGPVIYRNGQEIPREELKRGDKILLKGVTQPRRQSSGNGCWSVSIQSQLNYRGVDIQQEEIRAFRPNEYESGSCPDGIAFASQDRMQTFDIYTALIDKVAPNTAAMHYELNNPVTKDDIPNIRTLICHALLQANSPISLCKGNHFYTIVGIEGDTIHYLDPLSTDKNLVYTRNLDSFLIGSSFDLNWLQPLNPTLGGSITQFPNWAERGTNYHGGEAFSFISTGREHMEHMYMGKLYNLPLSDEEGNVSEISLAFQTPKVLHYKRLSGGNYNAEILEEMRQQLLQLPGAGTNPALKQLLQTEEDLLSGKLMGDDAGMRQLARSCHAALQGIEKQLETAEGQQREQLEQLQQNLQNNARDIRSALISTFHGRYTQKVSSTNKIIDLLHFSGHASQKRYKGYQDLREGFAGLLYLDKVKNLDPKGTAWIDALEAAEQCVADIRNSEALNNMVRDMIKTGHSYSVAKEQKLKEDKKKNEKATEERKEQKTEEKKQPWKPEEPDQAFDEIDKAFPNGDNRITKEALQEKLAVFENSIKLNRETQLQQERENLKKKNENIQQLIDKYELRKDMPDDQRTAQRENLTEIVDLRIAIFGGNTSLLAERFKPFEKVAARNASVPVPPPMQIHALKPKPKKEQQATAKQDPKTTAQKIK
ncbi:MAG: hypothetical protein Q4B50_05335, partial [Bacillota bacterium]|nr:hypothetical protein [Bacillota bacterium]